MTPLVGKAPRARCKMNANGRRWDFPHFDRPGSGSQPRFNQRASFLFFCASQSSNIDSNFLTVCWKVSANLESSAREIGSLAVAAS
jgi:hypothetical protein